LMSFRHGTVMCQRPRRESSPKTRTPPKEEKDGVLGNPPRHLPGSQRGSGEQARLVGLHSPDSSENKVTIPSNRLIGRGSTGRAPDTARRHVCLRRPDFAGIGLGVGNKLGNRLGRNGWINLHDKRPMANACDRRSVAYEIEIELIVKRDGDRVCRNDQKERIAVGGRTYDRLGADVACGARPVLNDEWLAEAVASLSFLC